MNGDISERVDFSFVTVDVGEPGPDLMKRGR